MDFCWDECLKRIVSFYQQVPPREHVWSREAALKAKIIRCIGETPQKEMKRLTSEGDMRRNIFIGNN
jgi:hypothetical protein